MRKKPALLIKDLPQISKPREKLVKLGPSNLSEKELLAILLRSGTKKQSALDLAAQVLDSFPLEQLKQQNITVLQKFSGIGPVKAVTLSAALELAVRLNQLNQESPLNSPQKVFFQAFEIKDKNQEHCLALYVDGSKQLLKKKTLAIGTLNTNFLEFRELLRPAFNLPAAGIILVHNHPSGDTNPSKADIRVTKQVADGCQLVGIDFIDHVIVTKNQFFSFRKSGLVE